MWIPAFIKRPGLRRENSDPDRRIHRAHGALQSTLQPLRACIFCGMNRHDAPRFPVTETAQLLRLPNPAANKRLWACINKESPGNKPSSSQQVRAVHLVCWPARVPLAFLLGRIPAMPPDHRKLLVRGDVRVIPPALVLIKGAFPFCVGTFSL